MLKRLFLFAFVICGCARTVVPPPIPREFRAAWVATVDNIDWPSKPGLSTGQQQQEILQILDKAKAIGLNAIILQVRTSCDALYPSPYEPWSYYLTGKQGRPPQPFIYDPLEMWVTEAHRRGIELHAWFNPFRAKPPNAKYPLAASHVANTQPNLAKQYGSVMWLDPGEPAAQDLTLKVMLDVVRRYDVDGVHIDDYFYPYPEKVGDFPDDDSYHRYQYTGGKLSRAHWRRENINSLVRRMYTSIKNEKPWVKVGISPFGIWKPGFPAVVKGFNQYESLYADAKLWLNQGWCDYFTPQLYWKTTAPQQPYEALLKWWVGEDTKGRHVWPGLFTSRINNTDKSWSPQDVIDQIEVTRRTNGATGHVHFSMKALMEDRKGIDEKLGKLYATPALVPASPWLSSRSPAPPHFTAHLGPNGMLQVDWKTSWFEKQPWLWVVYLKYGDTWRAKIFPAAEQHATFIPDEKLGSPTAVSVSAVDRLGNESRCVEAIPPRVSR